MLYITQSKVSQTQVCLIPETTEARTGLKDQVWGRRVIWTLGRNRNQNMTTLHGALHTDTSGTWCEGGEIMRQEHVLPETRKIKQF